MKGSNENVSLSEKKRFVKMSQRFDRYSPMIVIKKFKILPTDLTRVNVSENDVAPYLSATLTVYKVCSWNYFTFQQSLFLKLLYLSTKFVPETISKTLSFTIAEFSRSNVLNCIEMYKKTLSTTKFTRLWIWILPS